jgi:hypothetical protein
MKTTGDNFDRFGDFAELLGREKGLDLKRIIIVAISHCTGTFALHSAAAQAPRRDHSQHLQLHGA